MFRVRDTLSYDENFLQNKYFNNTTIAFLDTGISPHPDLTKDGRLLGFKDFINGKKYPYDDNGHGTHVCGIACGTGFLSNGKYMGIAPKANFVMGKVLNRYGEGRAEIIVEGLSWILKSYEKYHISILNLSLGIDDLKDKVKEDMLCNFIREIYNAGIVVVCAAGNQGPHEGSIHAFGTMEEVITVGCHEGGHSKRNNKACETYSGRENRAERIHKPDLVAPGTNIISCSHECISLPKGYKNCYIAKSGTSMSTPIVSGAVALFFQKYGILDVSETKRKILSGTMDLGEHWTKQGHGILNLKKLLED